jgi:hypothetical protein
MRKAGLRAECGTGVRPGVWLPAFQAGMPVTAPADGRLSPR